MKSYSPNELALLKDSYVSAAVDLVIEGGWSALTVRNVGARVGKSGTAIHRVFKGDSLKEAVVCTAFGELMCALSTVSNESGFSTTDARSTIVKYLRANAAAPKLMVQVSALHAAQSDPAAKVMDVTIARAWAVTMFHYADMLKNVDPPLSQRAREIRAEDLISWYIGACVTLVMRPQTSDPDLVRLFKD